MSQLLPALSDADRAALFDSIRQDGVVIPVAVDRNGEIVDGHTRKEIADELGIPCPTVLLDVEDDVADRLRLSLNLARRQLDTVARAELLAALAKPLMEKAKAAAKSRSAANLNRGATPGSPSGKALPTREQVAETIAAETAAAGAPIKVTGRTVSTAVAVSNLADDAKDRIRSGQSTVTAELRKTRPKPERIKLTVPDDFDADGKIRALRTAESLGRATLKLADVVKAVEALDPTFVGTHVVQESMGYFGELVNRLDAWTAAARKRSLSLVNGGN